MEATFTIRAVSIEQVKKAIGKLSLQKNENGQCTNDAILILKKQLLQILASQFYDATTISLTSPLKLIPTPGGIRLQKPQSSP